MACHGWTRRRFLSATARAGVLLAGGSSVSRAGWLQTASLLPGGGPAAAGEGPPDSLKRLVQSAPAARFWLSNAKSTDRESCSACHEPGQVPIQAKAEATHSGVTIKCGLCARECMLSEGERGLCRARINDGGTMRSLVYGRPLSVHVDPIEKKPLFHFLPGSSAFSMSTSGCPLRCKFCQNWEISQARAEDYGSKYVSPQSVVATAAARRSPVIAFTYNEPTVFAEYLVDIARVGRKQGARSVLISCGYMNEAPLAEMCQVLDAIKIDLKGFSEDFYRDVCGARLAPVLRSIKQIAKSGTHLEIVNLVVPTLNDSVKMLTELSKWVAGEVGPNVPVHFTRFHPDYQLPHLPPTPVATLERAREIAMKEGIRYPFVGNVPGHAGNSTYCPKCGEAVITRSGFFIRSLNLKQGLCGNCGERIHGIWD